MKIHVAAIFSAGGVHFLTAATSAEELNAQLAGYVRQQAAWSLQDDDAGQVCRLLDGGAFEEGVRLYFERVGERWEKEALRIEVVPVTERGGDHHSRRLTIVDGGV